MSTRDIVLDRDLLDVLDSIDAVREQGLHLLHQQEQTIHTLQNGEMPTNQVIQQMKFQSRLISQVSQLRGVYRRAVISTRMTKGMTSDARAEVDKLQLQLQNLTYEQSHLKGEIAACEGYASAAPLLVYTCACLLTILSRHKYTSLPLIPAEEFLSIFPDKIVFDKHRLIIARIEHEHAERQALEEKRQGLLKRKQGLIAENNRRKEDLANLDKDLEKFIEVADPIIKTFEKEY
jgi:THO complex subunit 5